MQVKDAQAVRALANPDPAVQLFVLGGPDDSASRALVDRFAAAMGPEAERIDLEPRAIRETPSLLADEVAAYSLFGTRRWVRIDLGSSNGDDWVAAAQSVLAGSAGNPVVVVGSALTGKSKLFKLAQDHAAAVAVLSYLPDGQRADALAAAIAGQYGLTLSRESARAIADATGADQALMARECEKLALFLDAAPDRQVRAELDAWQAIGAATQDEDIGAIVNIVLGGRTGKLAAQLAEMEAMATSEIRVVRALAQRALVLARLRARMSADRLSAEAAVKQERAIFWKEQADAVRQLNCWSTPALARLVDRLHGLERKLKRSGGDPGLELRESLLWIARAAERGGAGAR